MNILRLAQRSWVAGGREDASSPASFVSVLTNGAQRYDGGNDTEERDGLCRCRCLLAEARTEAQRIRGER